MSPIDQKKLWIWVGCITFGSVAASMLITAIILYPDLDSQGMVISFLVPLIIAPVASYVPGRMWVRIGVLKTEAEQAADKIASVNQQLQDALARQQMLFSVLGHEIRTPASSLTMMLEEPGYMRRSENLDVARQSARHLVSVIDDMRALAKPDLMLRGTPAKSSPRSVLQQAVESQRILADRKQMQIQLDLPAAFDHVTRFNTQILRQVVLNLVRNSILHSQGSALDITGQGLGTDPMRFEVRFQDDGIGIAEGAHDAIFDPFQRGPSVSEGLGLGLHVCRDFLQTYFNGALTVETNVDGGATFVMVFELVSSDDKGGAQVEPAPYDFAGKRLLLIEDNDIVRTIIKAQLEKLGAGMAEAATGPEGLQHALQSTHDVILLDLHLPELMGDEVVRRLRAEGCTQPVIGLTASAMEGEHARLVEAGVDAVLVKPLDVSRLAHVLAGLPQG